MKISVPLLIALGIVVHAAVAQVQTSPNPPMPADIQPQQDMTPSSGAGTADNPADNPAPGRVQPPPDSSSGASDPMRSEAGAELRAAPAPASVAALKPVVQGDVTYLCGGVGTDEVNYVKSQAQDYDLMLTFSARDGAYLADVDVDISDARGNGVLQAHCNAPIMLVDLPHSGSYRVRANAAGQSLNRTVKVSAAKGKRSRVASATLVWPQQVAEGPQPGAPATSTGDTGAGTGASGHNDNGAR